MSNNAEISFYQLTFAPLEKALPKLMEKIYNSTNSNSFIICEDSEQMKLLDNLLWTAGRHFLPHDIVGCELPKEHAILLGLEYTNDNDAKILINLTNSFLDPDNFEKILILFNGFDEKKTQLARNNYKKYRELGHKINFWKQNENGAWENNN